MEKISPHHLFEIRPALAVGLLAGLLLSLPAAAFAQQDPADDPPAMTPQPAPAPAMPPKPVPVSRSVYVSKGEGKIVTLPQPVASIFAADPTVIDVRPASPTSLFIFGKGTGTTTLVTTDSNGNTVGTYSVTVGPSQYPSARLSGEAQNTAPGGSVTAESEPGGMVVSGSVQTPEQANNVINQAKIISPTGTVINNLQVNEPIQVQLKVRIASMSRTITRQLGIDWSSLSDAGFSVGKFALGFNTGTSAPTISGTTPGSVALGFPGGTFEGIIDALASDNLAHILAEPTLTTLSGTQASFQVGGQFPIPVSSQNNVVTVAFKNYGVQLTFVPTVFSDGRIALQVSPELSTVSDANSATLSTSGSNAVLVVPSLIITRATSTVILGSGQGMAIAGLLEDTLNQTDNAVPGLGEIPVLGALFRGDSFSHAQEEVVITVTPYLVNPVNNPGALASPEDGWTPANDLQRILLLRNNGTTTASATIPGDAGFMVQ